MPSISPDRDDARDLIAARALPGVGDIGLPHRLSLHGSAKGVLSTVPPSTRCEAYTSADAMIASTESMGAFVLVRTDSSYPARLLDLHDAPTMLFGKGVMATADAPAVAIVGTRLASGYGLRVARAIATACARAGVAVVSGLAQGVDGAAHEAALAAGGRTVAVLGTGLDIAYPRRHRALQEQIGRDGLLLSELPPGASGHGGTFPRRNRIIAALADLTVVVEAGEGSGALITADYAHTLDRRIACVPNAIDVPSSRGSNALLKAYAEPILSPDDVLSMLSLRAEPTPAPILDADAAACWDAIQRGATDLDSLAVGASLSIRAAASALTALELEGLVHVDVTGQIRSTLSSAVSLQSAAASS
jgi:DNA processing protein